MGRLTKREKRLCDIVRRDANRDGIDVRTEGREDKQKGGPRDKRNRETKEREREINRKRKRRKERETEGNEKEIKRDERTGEIPRRKTEKRTKKIE